MLALSYNLVHRNAHLCDDIAVASSLTPSSLSQGADNHRHLTLTLTQKLTPNQCLWQPFRGTTAVEPTPMLNRVCDVVSLHEVVDVAQGVDVLKRENPSYSTETSAF